MMEPICFHFIVLMLQRYKNYFKPKGILLFFCDLISLICEVERVITTLFDMGLRIPKREFLQQFMLPPKNYQKEQKEPVA